MSKPLIITKKRSRSFAITCEDDLHLWTMDVIRMTKHPYVMVYHCPNGGNRNPIEGRRFKERGVLPGVPDLHVFVRSRLHFLELKFGKNDLTPAQREFFAWAQNHRIPCEVARTQDQVMSILEEWNAVRPSGWQFRGHGGVKPSPGHGGAE